MTRPTEAQMRDIEWMAKHGASNRSIKAQTGVSYDEYCRELSDRDALKELRERERYGKSVNCGPWGDGE